MDQTREIRAALAALRERSSVAEILALYRRGVVTSFEVLESAWAHCRDDPDRRADLVRQFRADPDRHIADFVGGGLETLAAQADPSVTPAFANVGRTTVGPTSVFDFPTVGGTSLDFKLQKQEIREYIQNARDPNEAGENGRTLLLLAMSLCFEGDGEALVADLLDRGADTNQPSAWANFTALLMAANSLPLVQKFLDRGLRLNDVYEIGPEDGGLTTGPTTLLDHLDAVRAYISPKKKKLNALAKEYAGGLGKRRRFIDETIALLESRGAERAKELGRP